MKIIKLLTIVPLLFFLNTGVVSAIQLSVDLIPGGSINNSLTIMNGDNFDITIVLDEATDFSGFGFDLEFDSSILTATTITSGAIFGSDSFLIDDTISTGSLSFSEVSFAPSGLNIDSPTIIATLSFISIAEGVSALNLTNAILSDSFADELSPVNLASGNITVVPIPAAFWLFFTGLVGISRVINRKV